MSYRSSSRYMYLCFLTNSYVFVTSIRFCDIFNKHGSRLLDSHEHFGRILGNVRRVKLVYLYVCVVWICNVSNQMLTLVTAIYVCMHRIANLVY